MRITTAGNSVTLVTNDGDVYVLRCKTPGDARRLSNVLELTMMESVENAQLEDLAHA